MSKYGYSVNIIRFCHIMEFGHSIITLYVVTLSGKAIVSKMQLFNHTNQISYHGHWNECGSLEAYVRSLGNDMGGTLSGWAYPGVWVTCTLGRVQAVWTCTEPYCPGSTSVVDSVRDYVRRIKCTQTHRHRYSTHNCWVTDKDMYIRTSTVTVTVPPLRSS